jgi:hypothetical protein
MPLDNYAGGLPHGCYACADADRQHTGRNGQVFG